MIRNYVMKELICWRCFSVFITNFEQEVFYFFIVEFEQVYLQRDVFSWVFLVKFHEKGTDRVHAKQLVQRNIMDAFVLS